MQKNRQINSSVTFVTISWKFCKTICPKLINLQVPTRGFLLTILSRSFNQAYEVTGKTTSHQH